MNLGQSLLAAVPAQLLDICILHRNLLWEVAALGKFNGNVRQLTLWREPGFLTGGTGGWKRCDVSLSYVSQQKSETLEAPVPAYILQD